MPRGWAPRPVPSRGTTSLVLARIRPRARCGATASSRAPRASSGRSSPTRCRRARGRARGSVDRRASCPRRRCSTETRRCARARSPSASRRAPRPRAITPYHHSRTTDGGCRSTTIAPTRRLSRFAVCVRAQGTIARRVRRCQCRWTHTPASGDPATSAGAAAGSPVPAGHSIGAAWRPCADVCALTVQGDESIRWRVPRAARRGQASRARRVLTPGSSKDIRWHDPREASRCSPLRVSTAPLPTGSARTLPQRPGGLFVHG